jgi:signal recognition particle receptor subunit beta
MQKRHTGAIAVHISTSKLKKNKKIHKEAIPGHSRAQLKMKNVILGLVQCIFVQAN